MTNKTYLNWKKAGTLLHEVMRSMKGWQPDYVVGIVRGGCFPAGMYSHYAGVPMYALKVQLDVQKLLERFQTGSGTLYDLEYLTDETGRRVAAFGYWGGYAGAAVAIKSWAAAQKGNICQPLQTFASAKDLNADLAPDLGKKNPSVIIMGANGRVGSGAQNFFAAFGASVTCWDIE